MGTTGCKPYRSSSPAAADTEDAESVESLSIGKGVRVHHLEGNNFLGRLDDAGRMSYRGRGLWRRHNSNAPKNGSSTTAGGAGGSSSARSSCYSELSSGVWQHQQQHLQHPSQQRLLRHQHCLSGAPAGQGTGTGPPSSRSLDCGPAEIGTVVDGLRRDSSSPEADAVAADASQMDLTTLLLQGFDPAAYEQRMAERRLAKFARRPPRSASKALAMLPSPSTTAAMAAPTVAVALPGEALG